VEEATKILGRRFADSDIQRSYRTGHIFASSRGWRQLIFFPRADHSGQQDLRGLVREIAGRGPAEWQMLDPYFMEKAIPGPIAYWIGGFLRAPFLRWAKRTTAEVLSGLTQNKELIGVLAAQWGNYGLPPQQSSFGVHAMIAHHYFEGASYPVGGAIWSQPLPNRPLRELLTVGPKKKAQSVARSS
jgi:hypothetical protein